MLKILLFGQSGQLGADLALSLGAIGEVTAPPRDGAELTGDLSDLAGIAETVRMLRPDMVVNAAAWTDVDAAERHPTLVHLLNAEAPAALAAAAHEVGAWFVNYSSDYVFDGGGRRPWRETDVARPLNVYGQSKLLGDLAVARNCQRHLIFRTSWLYGTGGENFATTILRNIRKNGSLKVVNDQFGAPTSTRWLAALTAHALSRAAVGQVVAGLYHAAAVGVTSRCEYARFVVAQAVRLGLLPVVAVEGIEAVASTAEVGVAQRPLNSRLDMTRLMRVFALSPPLWQEGVRDLLENLS